MRVVSLVPSTTETVFALGGGDRLVGITRFCVSPEEGVASIPKVGGTKNPDLAAIRALAPDLILANLEENRREDVEALDAEFPVVVQYPRTARGAAEAVRQLGALLDLSAAAPMAARIEEAIAEVSARAAARASASTRTAVLIWRGPFWAVGEETYIADLLRLAGGTNVYADRVERYFEIDLADLAARAPDAVLLPDEPYPFSERHIGELCAALGERPRLLLADGRALSWHGSRTAGGLRYIERLLHG